MISSSKVSFADEQPKYRHSEEVFKAVFDASVQSARRGTGGEKQAKLTQQLVYSNRRKSSSSP